jgi:hypothetical protein
MRWGRAGLGVLGEKNNFFFLQSRSGIGYFGKREATYSAIKKKLSKTYQADSFTPASLAGAP